MKDNYPKAYREVYEILKCVPEEEVIKIPKYLINTIKINMDPYYDFKVDENLSFEELTLLRETKAIFAVIYRDYWADENQKARIIQKQEYDIQKAEEEKKIKYNYEDLFKNKTKEIKEETSQALVEYKEPNWYIKFVNFIKKFLKENKLLKMIK